MVHHSDMENEISQTATATEEAPKPQLVEGQKVWNHGFEFYARNIRLGEDLPVLGQVHYYTGECTENEVNDRIRNTGHNGATYSWRPTDAK